MKNKLLSLFNTELFKVSSLTGVSTIIRMVTGLILVKVISVMIGPSGLAMLGQLNGFTSIILVLATLGINNGVTKYLAEFKNSKISNVLIGTAIRVTTISSITLGVLLIVFSKFISEKILFDDKYFAIFIVFGITLVFYSINTILLCVLNGLKLYKKFVLLNILSSIVGLIFSVSLVYFFGLMGALIGSVTFQSIVLIATPFFLKDQGWFKLSVFKEKYSTKAFKMFLAFSAMTVFSTFVGPGIQLILRTKLIHVLGINDTGIWDSVNKLSTAYLAIFTTSLTVYFIPRFSEIQDKREIKNEIFKSIKLIAPLLLTVLICIYVLKGFIINLLFTEEFLKIKDIILFQLIGDFFKVISWLFAFILIAKAMTTQYIISELFFNLLLTGLTIWLVNSIGLSGTTLAYMINYIIFFIFYLMYFLNYVRNSPLVSVVIPAYNHEKYIRKCLQSIFDQTYQNIEIIVLNDGSTDQTLQLLYEINDKFDFILIDQKNIGLSNTLNKGIKLAKGKYIAIIASDDYWELDKIETQVLFLEKNIEYGMCCGKAYEVDDNGRLLGTIGDIKNKHDLEFQNLLNGNKISALTTLIKRDVLLDVGGFDPSLYIEDWDMWLRISVKYRIGFMNKYLAYYRLHNTNISHKTALMEKAKISIIKKWVSYSNYEKIYRTQVLKSFNELAGKDKKEALKMLRTIYMYWSNYLLYKGVLKLLIKW